MTTFPCYIVTRRLRDALESLPATGCEFRDVETSKSDAFIEINGDRELPEFVWLHVTGHPGADDFGMSRDHELVVSERGLDLMRRFSLSRCEIVEYDLAH